MSQTAARGFAIDAPRLAEVIPIRPGISAQVPSVREGWLDALTEIVDRSIAASMLMERAYDTADWDMLEEDAVSPSAELKASLRSFLSRVAHVASVFHSNSPMPLPEFDPNPDGTINVHWGHGTERQLLLGAKNNGTASFFGEDKSGQTIKGAVRLDSDPRFLVAWLLP